MEAAQQRVGDNPLSGNFVNAERTGQHIREVERTSTRVKSRDLGAQAKHGRRSPSFG